MLLCLSQSDTFEYGVPQVEILSGRLSCSLCRSTEYFFARYAFLWVFIDLILANINYTFKRAQIHKSTNYASIKILLKCIESVHFLSLYVSIIQA